MEKQICCANVNCAEERELYGQPYRKGLCSKCYLYQRRHGTNRPADLPPHGAGRRPSIRACVKCNEEKKIVAKDMCRKCYMRDKLGCKPQRSRIRACNECTEVKTIAARDLCRTCYSRWQYAQAHKKEV